LSRVEDGFELTRLVVKVPESHEQSSVDEGNDEVSLESILCSFPLANAVVFPNDVAGVWSFFDHWVLAEDGHRIYGSSLSKEVLLRDACLFERFKAFIVVEGHKRTGHH
jgi:hypothetical protein